MTVYQCDSCDSEMPGGAAGTSFLVRSNGRTDHFCSNACLHAFVNSRNQETFLTGRVIIGAICVATLMLHLTIALITTH